MNKLLVAKSLDSDPIVTVTGPAVGVASGAATGTVARAGALRDCWVAGKEEEWVIPLDSALEATGGHVFRRAITKVAEAPFDHGISAFKVEIKELESEASHASGAANSKLQAKLAWHDRGAKRSQAWIPTMEALPV